MHRNIDKTDIDKLVAELRGRFPDNRSNAIIKLDSEVDLVNEEDKILLKEAMQAGLLLTEGQFIAREMGQELTHKIVITGDIKELTRTVRDMLYTDYKKRDLKEGAP